LFGLCLWRRRRFFRGLCGHRLCSRARPAIDNGDDGVDGNGFAFLDLYLREHSRSRGWDLGVNLIGRYLKQRFVALTESPTRQPLDDRSFCDGFPSAASLLFAHSSI
jgi:hypothetical protein